MKKLKIFKTNAEYISAKESMEYPQVSYTNDDNNVWVLERPVGVMYVGSNSYEFLIGMTWNEFIASDYNPLIELDFGDSVKTFLTDEDGKVHRQHTAGKIYYDNSHVKGTDLIINGGEYYIPSDSVPT